MVITGKYFEGFDPNLVTQYGNPSLIFRSSPMFTGKAWFSVAHVHVLSLCACLEMSDLSS